MYQTMNPTWKKLRMWAHRKIKQYGEGLSRIERIVQENAKMLVSDHEKYSIDGYFDPYENIYMAVANFLAQILHTMILYS